MKRKLYQVIANKLQAMKNLENMDDPNGWYDKHAKSIEDLIKDHFPHGSGFDGDVWLDFNLSNPEKLVFSAEFHHLNENGYYDGWPTLKVTVKASLSYGIVFKVTGPKRKYVGDAGYFYSIFDEFLETEIEG